MEKREVRQERCAASDMVHQGGVTHYCAGRSVTPRHEAPQQVCWFITGNFSRSDERKKYALPQQRKGKGEGNSYASLPFPFISHWSRFLHRSFPPWPSELHRLALGRPGRGQAPSHRMQHSTHGQERRGDLVWVAVEATEKAQKFVANASGNYNN